MRNVHDLVTHVKEMFTHQWFGEEVGNIVGSGHEGHTDLSLLDAFADKEVTTMNVCSLMYSSRKPWCGGGSGTPRGSQMLGLAPGWPRVGTHLRPPVPGVSAHCPGSRTTRGLISKAAGWVGRSGHSCDPVG